jgi:hypothetical protein
MDALADSYQLHEHTYGKVYVAPILPKVVGSIPKPEFPTIQWSYASHPVLQLISLVCKMVHPLGPNAQAARAMLAVAVTLTAWPV